MRAAIGGFAHWWYLAQWLAASRAVDDARIPRLGRYQPVSRSRWTGGRAQKVAEYHAVAPRHDAVRFTPAGQSYCTSRANSDRDGAGGAAGEIRRISNNSN